MTENRPYYDSNNARMLINRCLRLMANLQYQIGSCADTIQLLETLIDEISRTTDLEDSQADDLK